jgi:hypothetical protein
MRRQGALIVAGLAIAAAGCGSATTSRSGPTGTVQGTFLDYPGPMPANGKPSTDPAAGKATFTDKSGRSVSVAVPATGKFSVRLAARTYTGLLAPADLDPVRTNVRVLAGQTLKITILCSWDPGSCGLQS